MKGKNVKQNNKYFFTLATGVVGGDEKELEERVQSVYPMQLKVGQLFKFTYVVKRKDYTAVVAATPRAPGGKYVAAMTRNPLVTEFLLDDYPVNDQIDFLTNLYTSDVLRKRKLITYRPTNILGFWKKVVGLFNHLFNSQVDLKNENFRTFITKKMMYCKVLK